MVLAIVGSMATVAIITLAAMSAGFDRMFCRYSYSPDSATCLSSHEARVAVGVLLCLLAFTDAVVAIVGAGMSCGALCCSTGHSTPQPNVMVCYTTGPQMTVPQQSAMSNPAYGGPPNYEEAIHDPVVGAQGGAEAKDVIDHDYVQPYPIKVKPADLGSQI
ncbi:uncharacterized protein LOC119741454 [Patiria miniata]|uniref:Uncharacterized protein n=1 Tax=Patiria miniata TaxID=46514 RepID=A0A914BAV8_PATMI|nr:uncharacterized protein LOC119741311 [Patiria miniata]XP_038072999.1 uncharacterized protein LOC119741311 [Patiria miniata]XP_038073006.1 uncharacterized protein LOC119741311 [Patiria miniata]XP_038073140.1 uncharacterized protein LOC119741454 [Patiria miniata]XP_038073146.1 uncharacterized protein LOC119741454 [Patiria miniata]XP_038073154.1 uncharacterized protein LOC119741454 [Patiria miniata]